MSHRYTQDDAAFERFGRAVSILFVVAIVVLVLWKYVPKDVKNWIRNETRIALGAR